LQIVSLLVQLSVRGATADRIDLLKVDRDTRECTPILQSGESDPIVAAQIREERIRARHKAQFNPDGTIRLLHSDDVASRDSRKYKVLEVLKQSRRVRQVWDDMRNGKEADPSVVVNFDTT
jgi:hypothetical protein